MGHTGVETILTRSLEKFGAYIHPSCPLYSILHQSPSTFLPETIILSSTATEPSWSKTELGPRRTLIGLLTVTDRVVTSGVEVERGWVAVGAGEVLPICASTVASLFSIFLTLALLARVCSSVETLIISLLTRSDRLERVTVPCACNCEKPNTNNTTTINPIPTVLCPNMKVPPCPVELNGCQHSNPFASSPERGRNAPIRPFTGLAFNAIWVAVLRVVYRKN